VRPKGVNVTILTPVTSIAALRNGFIACLHQTAFGYSMGLDK
jgi:hypothetical protein